MHQNELNTFSPIFVGGQMKSGTTMVRALLGQHPNIFGGLETHWFDINFQERKEKDKALQKLEGLFNLSSSEINLIMSKKNLDNKEFLSIFMNYVTKRANKIRWVEKTPGNIFHLQDILVGWPTAKFIHVIRDWRDTYASWKKSNKKSIQDFIHYSQKALEIYDENKNENTYIVQYEKLVLDRYQTLQNLFDFLSEDLREECLQLNTQNSRYEYATVSSVTGKKSSTLISTQSAINSDKIGVYKKVLNKQEIELIEDKFSIYFERFGYN